MAIEVKGIDIIDDDRNIVGANTYNGYVPVNPTRGINSGNGIVGGGNLGADRTLSIRAGDGLTANTTGIHIVTGNGLSVSSSNVYVDEAYLNVRYANYRLLNNTALTFSEQIGIPANTGGVVVYGHAKVGAPSDSPSNAQGAGIYITNLWREHQLHFDSNYKVFHKSGTNVDEFWTTRNLPNPANTATSIVAGNGLTGGGNLAASRTLTVGAGDGISVLATTVNVDNTVVRTSDTKNYSTTGSISAGGITSTNGLTVNAGGLTVTGYSTLNGTLNVNNHIVAKNSLYVDSTNTNIHLWFREASNNATRGVYHYDNVNHALKMQLYAVDNSSSVIARTDLYGDRFASSVPFSGSGSGLTNLPATSLTGTIDDARLPTTVVRTSRTVTAGAGLTGGGALSGNITLTVGKGDGITINATNVAVDSTVVRTSRTVTAGNGLSGGGALSGNISLTVGAGDGITVGATTVGVDSTVVRNVGPVYLVDNQIRFIESNGVNYIQSSNGTVSDYKTLRFAPLDTSAAKFEISNTAVTAGNGMIFAGNGAGLTSVSADAITGILGTDHLPNSVVYNTRTVTAGNGLTGGGALSGNITLTVGKGDGITVNATNVAVDSTVVRSSDDKNYTTTGSISSDGGNFISRYDNGSSYLWFRDSSNNANRGVFYYNRNFNNLTGQLYSLSNTSDVASYFVLAEDKFSSTVPFTGSGSGLTNLPATSLTGTIDDARLPATVVRTSHTVTAGAGLTGGGALSGNISLAIGKGDGITVGATTVGVDSTVMRNNASQTLSGALSVTSTISSNGDIITGGNCFANGDLLLVGNATRAVRFRTPSGVTRGDIIMDSSTGYLDVRLMKFDGGFDTGMSLRPQGIFSIGSGLPPTNLSKLPVTGMFESPVQAIVNGGLYPYNHGLGGVPLFVTVEFRCKVAQDSFLVGDIIEGSFSADPNGDSEGTGLLKTATNITIKIGSNGPGEYVAVRGGGGGIFLESAKWNMVVRAFR